ncbi:hypothetical protein HDV00_000205 [Rhizophlyctis rosea]|nr:hypothetical protein HDV00_000205 [Rhizophlyctis rosea]
MTQYARVPTDAIDEPIHLSSVPTTKRRATTAPDDDNDIDDFSDSGSDPHTHSHFIPQSKRSRFIKLVGAPKNEPTASTEPAALPKDAAGAPIKPVTGSPSTPDSPEEPVIDVLDAQNEDPFTLEPFENLIQLHADAGKDFIMARVTTVDPNDESRFYYSYYAAHHINKVLFRTQPEEGLLHRMKAKNPLNNMTIVGDVHYYVITAAAVKLMNSMSVQNSSRASIDSVSSIHSINSIRSMITQQFAGTNYNNNKRRNSELFRRYNRPRSAGAEDSHHGRGAADISKRWSQFLQVAGLTVPPKKRTLHLVMRPNALEGSEEVVPLSPGEGGKSNSKFGPLYGRPTSAGATTTTRHAPEDIPLLNTSRRNSADDAFVDTTEPIQDTVRASLDERRPTNLPQNETTTSGFRPTSTTPRLHRRVRSTAFSNEHHKNMSIHEWIQLHALEDDTTTPSKNPTTTTTTSSSSSTDPTRKPPKLIITPSTKPTSNKRTPELEEQPLSSTPTGSQLQYLARYYATDDDFLMNASIRAWFRDNALETDDAVLFTIPRSTDAAMNMEGMEQHPALMNFVYAVDEGEGGGRGLSILSGRAMKWLLVGYVALGFVVVEFVVPQEYAYVTAFLLIFVLAVVLILCL